MLIYSRRFEDLHPSKTSKKLQKNFNMGGLVDGR